MLIFSLFLSGCAGSVSDYQEEVQETVEEVSQTLELPEPEAIPEPEEILEIEEVIEEEQVREAPVKSEQGRYVYLTFDDGPSRNTSALLDILKAHDILGTFFFQGSMLLNQPDVEAVLARTLKEGHYIGLHSMTHDPYQLYWSHNAHQTFIEEMKANQELLYELSGFTSRLVRPPFGTGGTFTEAHVQAVSESEFKLWEWSVDSRDWYHESTGTIMEEIKATMTELEDPDLVVVLFHEHDLTLEVLPEVIAYFKELGYEFLPYHPDNHFPMNLLDNPDL